VYWRRNFHPEDPPAIPTDAAFDPGYRAFEARLRRELHALSASLKKSVPFHSPRYIGHMASDLLLPGLAAQILTLPYNPNNVSEDAAPVTVDMEVDVGLQLARMVGYPHDPAIDRCAFGHLTSGGTVANYQAMRLALALEGIPGGVARGRRSRPGRSRRRLGLRSTWVRPRAPSWSHAGRHGWPRTRRASAPPGMRRVQAERIEQRGLCDFFARAPRR
jgi:hypothetical protein